MKFSELIPLTAGFLNLALTIFVAGQGLRSTASRVYLLWGLSLTVWNLGTFGMFAVESKSEALFFARFLQFGVIFLPISLAHLCYLIGHLPANRFIYAGYLLHILLAVTNFTEFFIADVRDVGYAYYAVAGPGFWVLVLTYSIPALALYHLARTVPSLPPFHRRRVVGMIGAVVTLIVFGFNDSLPILGVDRYPWFETQVFPFGSAAAIFYGIIVGYNVLQHQLLDIHVTLSRVAAHGVRFLFLFLIGLLLLLLLAVLAPEQQPFNRFTFLSSLAAMSVSAVTASVFFPRLFGSGDEAIERRILGDRFEYHDRLRGFIQSMHGYSDPDQLLDSLHTLLLHTVRASSYHVFVQEEKTGVFSSRRCHPAAPSGQAHSLPGGAAFFRLFGQSHAPYAGIRDTRGNGDTPELAGRAWGQTTHLSAEYCFPLYADGSPFGLFFLGRKRSGEPYTLQDLNAFVELVANLGLHLNKERLKKQVLLAQEMDLLGMMSRGMAHDLNNLMTPIWAYLQLVRESAHPEEPSTELLPTVIRNAETVMQYIRESLFFSDTQGPHLASGNLSAMVLKAVDLATPRAATRRIQLLCAELPEAPVEVDAVMIQRLVANLLSNAIDASGEGGSVHVRLHRLHSSDTSRDWFRLEVIDQGHGISPENLEQVAKPYFTTKDRGDGLRGFGLGLAICRKVVHLHNGNLNILSEQRKGTTVQVDLPSRQLPSPAPLLPRRA